MGGKVIRDKAIMYHSKYEKKPLRQNVFSYAYLTGQNVLLKVRNTSAINMGPIRYDTTNLRA